MTERHPFPFRRLIFLFHFSTFQTYLWGHKSIFSAPIRCTEHTGFTSEVLSVVKKFPGRGGGFFRFWGRGRGREDGERER